MAIRLSCGQEVRIGSNVRGNVTAADVERLIEIAVVYFPNHEETGKLLRRHIECADSLRIARDKDNRIVGYSIASASRQLTPFYPRPITLVYQRMLYLDPDILKKGLGKRLLCATFADLLGPFWPFRRLALVCRTLNPVVARMMDMHSLSYPHLGEQLPDEVRRFAESLLPMLGARELDAQCRLLGTLDEFKGVDYTDIWNRHLHKRNEAYEELMLTTVFAREDGRIINNGALLFMIAYSKPFRFIRFLFH
jgi:hypothetical protein